MAIFRNGSRGAGTVPRWRNDQSHRTGKAFQQASPSGRRRVLYVEALNDLTDKALAERLNNTGEDADTVIRYHKKTGNALPLRRINPALVRWLRETHKKNPGGIFQFNVYTGWEDERTVETMVLSKPVRTSGPVAKAKADYRDLTARNKDSSEGKGTAGQVSQKSRPRKGKK